MGLFSKYSIYWSIPSLMGFGDGSSALEILNVWSNTVDSAIEIISVIGSSPVIVSSFLEHVESVTERVFAICNFFNLIKKINE